MPVIKRCYIPLAILLLAGAASRYFGTGSGAAMGLGLCLVLPSALVVAWKTLAVLAKDWRSAENWVFALTFLAAAAMLAMAAMADIGSYQILI